MKQATKNETVDIRETISDLRIEAGSAGDTEMVEICDRALEGDSSAIKECIDAMDAAAAMGVTIL